MIILKRILIIEDERSIAELERDYLEINGYTVDIECSGKLGLLKAENTDYDLIILDIMLPEINGFEICREIRKLKDIPIIMISAKKEDVDKIRGLGLGADDYVTKPFSPGELVARVKAHLSRYDRLSSKEDKKEEIKIRGLVIDKVSRRVFVNDKECIFTTKEFDLLTFLASNTNRVFTKDQLFNSIWAMDSQGDLATVTVHIRKIREKIEVDPSNPQYIQTIWGVGYRFEA
ncbi:response regulator transcription factor [Clostridium akagii]|uniref:response regulator transcription factor n=1 Tax=Clostridium akagii TaxID=91623 RepID=UPI0031018EF7